jgi:hypothetical protein
MLLLLVGLSLPLDISVSATAPLLQSWFSDLDHEYAGDPYFLYASSMTPAACSPCCLIPFW